MSLYGLDIIIDKTNTPRIIEVNGSRSGMTGFRNVYGDDRVSQRVYSMLEEKHGRITVNDGSYEAKKYREEHPVASLIFRGLLRVPFTRNKMLKFALDSHNLYSSVKAHSEWLSEKVPFAKKFELPFELYDGQESTVLNLTDDRVAHPTINTYVQEQVTRNKLFTYMIFHDSEMKEALPVSLLVGLGLGHKKDLEEMLERGERFVQKPILGAIGLGVRIIGEAEIRALIKDSGRMKGSRMEVFDWFRIKDIVSPKYVEELIGKNDFSFAQYISLLQPFVRSKRKVGKREYSSIRAIVCNGKFVDAYKRVDDKPVVNLAQGARTEPFHIRSVKGFEEFCERAVSTFEEGCAKYDDGSFKRQLYDKYFEIVGRRSREIDLFVATTAMISTLQSAERMLGSLKF